jgi:hypothetical protein
MVSFCWSRHVRWNMPVWMLRTKASGHRCRCYATHAFYDHQLTACCIRPEVPADPGTARASLSIDLRRGRYRAQSYKSETFSVLPVTTVHVFFTHVVVSVLLSPPGPSPRPPSST